MKCTKILAILLVIWLIIIRQKAHADNRLIVYLKNAPPQIVSEVINDMAYKDTPPASMQNIKNFETERIKNEYKKLLTPKLSGFTAVYGGYMDISNKDGIIQFPLRQASNKIYVAFTEKIKFIRVKNNTFSHREFDDPKKRPTKLYLYEKTTDSNKNQYWRVKEAALPEDRKISPLALVIFTHPSNVIVPQGDFLCSDSQHFILPDIYVINTFNQTLVSLAILKLKRFFEAVKYSEKDASDKSSQGILNNT